MARITHPRPQAGKQTFVGVTFYDGFAEVADLHPEVRAALVLHNFTIEDTERPVQPKKRSGKRKPAKPGKAAEVKAGTPVDPDSGDEGPFAIVEMFDGTIIGDGKSLPTLPSTSFN
jgi:hypothetical protein